MGARASQCFMKNGGALEEPVQPVNEQPQVAKSEEAVQSLDAKASAPESYEPRGCLPEPDPEQCAGLSPRGALAASAAAAEAAALEKAAAEKAAAAAELAAAEKEAAQKEAAEKLAAEKKAAEDATAAEKAAAEEAQIYEILVRDFRHDGHNEWLAQGVHGEVWLALARRQGMGGLDQWA